MLVTPCHYGHVSQIVYGVNSRDNCHLIFCVIVIMKTTRILMVERKWVFLFMVDEIHILTWNTHTYFKTRWFSCFFSFLTLGTYYWEKKIHILWYFSSSSRHLKQPCSVCIFGLIVLSRLQTVTIALNSQSKWLPAPFIVFILFDIKVML